MTRFSAVTLDLSRFPAPLAIRGVSYETVLAERKALLGPRMIAAGIDFDVAMLETDPAVILEETDAYREMLTLSAINDGVRACMIAFATGSDLDHMAAFYGLTRRIIAPATGSTPAVMESDAEFRRRALLAPEAFATAGTHGGYVFHALASDTRVLNADVWSPEPGQVIVAVQSREGDGTAPTDLVASVRDHLLRPDIKPLTDMVTVRSVVNVPYSIAAEVFVLPGPDPVMVKTDAVASIEAMAASRRTPARDVPRSAVYAAASVGPVDKVIIAAPAADIARDYGEVGVCTGIDVTVTTYAG